MLSARHRWVTAAILVLILWNFLKIFSEDYDIPEQITQVNPCRAICLEKMKENNSLHRCEFSNSIASIFNGKFAWKKMFRDPNRLWHTCLICFKWNMGFLVEIEWHHRQPRPPVTLSRSLWHFKMIKKKQLCCKITTGILMNILCVRIALMLCLWVHICVCFLCERMRGARSTDL